MTAVSESVGKAVRDPRAVMGVATDRATAVRSAIEGARDAFRLRQEHSRLVPPLAVHTDLQPLYREYLADVSTADMAVSWESATYVHHLCDVSAPRRVLDLGSGFSSYVLRHYAATVPHDVTVVSVDDS